ncbi:MAG: glycoside hydrolase family 68 protein [Sphingomonas sp.]
MMPFAWLPSHVAAIAAYETSTVIASADAPAILAGHDVWDHWPVLLPDGVTAQFGGGALVIALTAPILPDPDARHAIARLWLFHRTSSGWRDMGPLFPDGFSPGSREWAGSAIFDASQARLMVYFTAAGMNGQTDIGFEQRLFETAAQLAVSGQDIMLGQWSPPREMVVPDGRWYETDMAGGGAIGTIKAFRDPYVFTDHASGREFMLFAGSSAGPKSAWNGVVGIAERAADTWQLRPPLVTATGLNNELERPHCVDHGGQTYLFWSTQQKVFAPDGPIGPTGLYGIVASSVAGPWRPLNDTGLVFANPPQAPFQAYSWQVLSDLTVWSFADCLGLPAAPADSEESRAHFAGAPAPVLQLRLKDARAWLS